MNSEPSTKSLAVWLLSVCGMILLTVIIGGITRLTSSGLSITEWQPIMGAIPPLTEAAWLDAFEKYKHIPQYSLLNAAMSLAEFKVIFFWEYLHRLIGRIVGLVFLIPWFVFWIKGRVPAGYNKKLALGFFLGALQGAVGWYMVMSGLADRPYVSHYRLALHLALALFVMSYLYWLALSLLIPSCESVGNHRLSRALKLILTLVSVQIIFGAFTAGLKAGFVFNTFPLMNGEWIPRNFFESTAAVQFIHRWLGVALFVSVAIIKWRVSVPSRIQKALITGVLHLVIFQFLLGIAVLISKVNVWVAVFHQVGACALLLMVLSAIYFCRVKAVG